MEDDYCWSMTFYPLTWVQAARAHQVCEKSQCGESWFKSRQQEGTALPPEPLSGCCQYRDPGPFAQALQGCSRCWQRYLACLSRTEMQHISHQSEGYRIQHVWKFPQLLPKQHFAHRSAYNNKKNMFSLFPFSESTLHVVPFLRQWLTQQELLEFGGKHHQICGTDSQTSHTKNGGILSSLSPQQKTNWIRKSI